MGVGEDFGTFCSNLAVTNRSSISDRYELITRRFNLDFWNVDSKTYHSIYAGSYGRNTATGSTSDVDMIFWLPVAYYNTYNSPQSSGVGAVLRLTLGQPQPESYLREPPATKALGRFTEMFRQNPLLPKRITAVRAFAGGALYAQATGEDAAGKASTDVIDQQVADLLSLF